MLAQAPLQSIVFGGTSANLRSVGAIAPLEADLGVPVVSAIQASFWDALRLAGVRDSKAGFGRLFAF